MSGTASASTPAASGSDLTVGFVTYGGLRKTSGGYRYDRRLATALRRRGVTVEVIALTQHSYHRNLLDNIVPAIHRRLEQPVDLFLQDELCHPSLVWPNSRLEVPIVSIVHHLRADEPRRGSVNRLYRFVETRYLGTVDGVVCNSQTTYDRVAGYTSVPGVVAPPAADHLAPATPPSDESLAQRAHATPFRLCFLGNLIPRKGLDTLIRGLARFQSRLSGQPDSGAGEWHLAVIGDPTVAPEYARRCRRLVDDQGLQDNVTFTGRLSDSAVADRLTEAHVLAIPSRYEGFGLAYLEAMAYGTVPLASSAGGATDFVTDGSTGLVVPPDDSDAIAERLRTVFTDRDRLASLSIAARERFASHPTWNDVASRVHELFEEVLDRR